MSKPESELGNLNAIGDFASTARRPASFPSARRSWPRLESLAALEIPSETLRSLPADFVKRHRVLPFKLNNGTIHVAAAEPGNQRVIEDIRLLTGLEVEESEASANELLQKIAECYQVTVEQMIENLHPARAATAESKNLHDIEVM